MVLRDFGERAGAALEMESNFSVRPIVDTLTKMTPDKNATPVRAPETPPEMSDDREVKQAERGPVKAEEPAVKVGKVLSPEEQMARYEESLKESDWGHQPC